MNKQSGENYQVIISEAQLRQRIALLGRQISQDFQGRELLCVGVLENGFALRRRPRSRNHLQCPLPVRNAPHQ